MARKFSRLLPGVAATVLAAAAGLGVYWLGIEERPATVAGSVQAKTPRAGKLEPPSWDPNQTTALKGEAEKLFRTGMEAYVRRDYPAASESLYRAAMLAPGSPEIHLFLGVSYLMTSDAVAGIRELKTAIGLGRGPHAAEARLQLGRALIERGDAAAAREYLAPVASDKGPHGEQARALIASSYPSVGN